MTTQVLAAIGFLLSAYAFYVKIRAGKSKSYKPLCDIKKNISCTKAFTSKYGSIAVLPNPVYGMVFYLLLFIIHEHRVLLYLSTVAMLGTIYLAYLSYIKQQNYCLVCSGIYVVNILLFLVNLF